MIRFREEATARRAPAKTDDEKITRSGKAWLWLRKQAHAAWMKWIAYRSSFVFTDEFLGWPAVRHTAPGVLVMKAPYIGPRKVQDVGGFWRPVGIGVCFGGLYGLAYWTVATREVLILNSVIVGVIVALISIPLLKLARKTRLVIRFDQGAISWRGPDRVKRRVKPEEPRSLQVLTPHRWANEERVKHENWMRSHPGQSGPKPLFQTSSELVMHTGPGGMNWLTIAEFCNDGSGEQAHRLQMAIDFVTDRAVEELAAIARAAQ